MRVICWFLGGHDWSGWEPLVIAGWLMNGDPRVRYCRRCFRFDHNADARVLTKIAYADEGAEG